MVRPDQTFNPLSDSGKIERGAAYSNNQVESILFGLLSGEADYPDVEIAGGTGNTAMFAWNGTVKTDDIPSPAIAQVVTMLPHYILPLDQQLEETLSTFKTGIEGGEPPYSNLEKIVIPAISQYGRGFFGMIYTPDPDNINGGTFEILDTSGSHEIINWYRNAVESVFPDATITDSPPYKLFAFQGFGGTETDRFLIPGTVNQACGPTTIRNLLIALYPDLQTPHGDGISTLDHPEQWRINDAEILNQQSKHDARLPDISLDNPSTWPCMIHWASNFEWLHTVPPNFQPREALDEASNLYVNILRETDDPNQIKSLFLKRIMSSDQEGQPNYPALRNAMISFTRNYMGNTDVNGDEAVLDSAAYLIDNLETDRAELSSLRVDSDSVSEPTLSPDSGQELEK